MPSHSSLESAFVHRGVHTFLLMLSLRSPFSRQGAALAHLDSLLPHDLVLWTDGSDSFLLARAAPAYLPTALSVAPRPLFLFEQAHLSSFSAEACAILHALCWSRQHQQACHSLFFYCLTLVLFCPLLRFSFYPKLWQIWQELSFFSSCSIRL